MACVAQVNWELTIEYVCGRESRWHAKLADFSFGNPLRPLSLRCRKYLRCNMVVSSTTTHAKATFK